MMNMANRILTDRQTDKIALSYFAVKIKELEQTIFA